jgi:hypothetical protein
MKRSLLSVIVVFLFASKANSQLEKNTWLVGGNGFYSTKEFHQLDSASYTTINEFRFSPNVGFFVIDKLAFGIRASYTTISARSHPAGPLFYQSSDLGKRRALEFGPFVRYYFLKPDKLANVFVDASWLPGIIKTITTAETLRTPTNSYSISAGAAIFFNPSLSIELSLGYSRKKLYQEFYDNEIFQNKFLINIGFQIHLAK